MLVPVEWDSKCTYIYDDTVYSMYRLANNSRSSMGNSACPFDRNLR